MLPLPVRLLSLVAPAMLIASRNGGVVGVPPWYARAVASGPGWTQRRHLQATTSSVSTQQMDLGRHFYLNKVLEQYASKPATRTTLRQLVFFGKTLGRDRDKIMKVRDGRLWGSRTVSKR